jgi:hypothetical protein
MSGKISTLNQPRDGYSSYNLTFWGPILECETLNHTVEVTHLQSDVYRRVHDSGGWWLKNWIRAAELRSYTGKLTREGSNDIVMDSVAIAYRLKNPTSPFFYPYYPAR